MKIKRLIVTIISVFVFFSGGLAAEEVVGKSIFPNIETTHPFAKVKKGEIVWSDVIFQSGASWIKIHFTDFQLDDDDYVELINKKGAVATLIKGDDVSDAADSIYAVIPTGKKKVSFWAPAVDGDMLRVEIKRGASKRKGKKWGFKIDEVGVGFIPLSEDGAVVESSNQCNANDLEDIACHEGHEPYDRGQAVGRMLYRVNGIWYKGTGFLLSCNNSSHFFTCSDLVFHQHIVNTLEVAFGYHYSVCSCANWINHSTYFGYQLISTEPSYKYTLLTLRSNPYQEEGISPLQPHSREPTLDEDIYLIQHPDGAPKMIGFGNVSNINGSYPCFFHYIYTPYLTSMGSPILSYDEIDNDNDKVLGFDYGGSCPNRARKMSEIYDRIKEYIGCD